MIQRQTHWHAQVTEGECDESFICWWGICWQMLRDEIGNSNAKNWAHCSFQSIALWWCATSMQWLDSNCWCQRLDPHPTAMHRVSPPKDSAQFWCSNIDHAEEDQPWWLHSPHNINSTATETHISRNKTGSETSEANTNEVSDKGSAWFIEQMFNFNENAGILPWQCLSVLPSSHVGPLLMPSSTPSAVVWLHESSIGKKETVHKAAKLCSVAQQNDSEAAQRRAHNDWPDHNWAFSVYQCTEHKEDHNLCLVHINMCWNRGWEVHMNTWVQSLLEHEMISFVQGKLRRTRAPSVFLRNNVIKKTGQTQRHSTITVVRQITSK